VEVAGNIFCPLILIFVLITLISLDLMCINQIVKEFNNDILIVIDTLYSWLDVEWETTMSLDAEEPTVAPE